MATYSLKNVLKSFRFSVTSLERIFLTIGVSILLFVLLVLLTFPTYSFDAILGSGSMLYLIDSLLWGVTESSGILGLVLLVLYSASLGVLTTVVIGSVQYQFSIRKKTGVVGLIPILFSGCASCGAGVLGLIGLFGYTSLFPFGGNIVRLLGILFVGITLSIVGDPRYCSIYSSNNSSN